MAKVIKQRYEYVSLSDVPQAVPYPAGYSPSLPTPPMVSPVSTTGISVLDQYISDNTVSAANGYGLQTLTVLSGSSLPQATLNIPAGSNLVVYPLSTVRVGIYTTTPLVPNGTPTLLVWACEPGRITSFPSTFNAVGTGLVVLSGTTPGNLGIQTSAGTNTAVTVLWWQ